MLAMISCAIFARQVRVYSAQTIRDLDAGGPKIHVFNEKSLCQAYLFYTLRVGNEL